MNRESVLQPKIYTPVQSGILQRQCACGQHAGGGECEECKKKKRELQRKRDYGAEPYGTPPVVHDVLRSPGEALPSGLRGDMETRFGQDFSRVRVHNDTRASDSARAVSAQAYTVGNHVVFGAGRYRPSTSEGLRLLAHELTHVVQQKGQSQVQARPLQVGRNDDPAEKEADSVAEKIGHGNHSGPVSGLRQPSVQRKLTADKPADMIPNPGGKGVSQTNADTVKDYLSTLCPGGGVTLDSKSGVVGVAPGFCEPLSLPHLFISLPSLAQMSKTPTGCGCICDLVKSANDWVIKIDDGSWPHTIFSDSDAANGKKPGGSGGIVTAPSPNSPKLWGAGTASGKTLDIDPWLVLGHELCGHAWLGDGGRHGPDEVAPRGEGGHQETVARENELRKEHGIELRGTFKQPNCGESYWRDKKKPGVVNWSRYRDVCKKWRAEYNKKHKTKYKITDTIP